MEKKNTLYWTQDLENLSNAAGQNILESDITYQAVNLVFDSEGNSIILSVTKELAYYSNPIIGIENSEGFPTEPIDFEDSDWGSYYNTWDEH